MTPLKVGVFAIAFLALGRAIFEPELVAQQQLERQKGPVRSGGYEPPPLRMYDTVYVLPIGINGYAGKPLRLAESDATAAAKLFQERYGYQVHSPLLGSVATKKGIEAAIDEYKNKLRPNDVLIVFFAGHGESIGRENDLHGYLVPFDFSLSTARNQALWDSGALDMISFAQKLRALPSRHVLAIVDACYSGILGMSRSGGPMTGHADLDDLLSQPSRLVLAAGTEKQQVFEAAVLNNKPATDSVFTTALLEALNTDRPMSVGELGYAVYERVAAWSDRKMQPLVRNLDPALHGEFVFIPKGYKPKQGESARDTVRGVISRGELAVLPIKELYDAISAEDYHFSLHPEEADKSWQERVTRFEHHAVLGDSVAKVALSVCFSRGLGTAKNPAEARRWALEAYYDYPNDGAALYGLSRVYRKGLDVDRNELHADELLNQSAETGFAPALVARAVASIESSRDTSGRQNAIHDLEKAGSLDYPLANVELSVLYDGTWGVAPNPQKRLLLVKALAEKGDAGGQYQMFLLYGAGRSGDLAKNPPEALKWLTKSAGQGNRQAQADLAFVYRQGATTFGLQTDIQQARKWAELAAAQGSSKAQMTLFSMYRAGDGGPPDMDLARKYLDDARRDPNNSSAMVAQAELLQDGILYGRDKARAIGLFAQAAQRGNINGMTRLALSYEECNVELMNPPKPGSEYCLALPGAKTREFDTLNHFALYWYARSALKGHSGAASNVKRYSPDSMPRFLSWMRSQFPADEQISVEEFKRLGLSWR